MNWFKKLAQANYLSEWGEHHGDVAFKPDTWNYGPKGYPSGTEPMPLPKKVYHVTPFADEIIKDGFKTFTDMKQQTFGGHGTYISTTTLSNARLYIENLRDFSPCGVSTKSSSTGRRGCQWSMGAYR